MKKREPVILTEGDIGKQLLMFVWPILLANVFQQVYNITNSMIVGNYMSYEALAAVGASTSVINLAHYFFYGVSTAAGILVSHYYGAKDQENLRKAVETGLVMAVVVAISLTAFTEIFMSALLDLSNVTDALREYTESYLRVYCIGYVAVFLYNMCFFIMRSLGDSMGPLIYLIMSCVVNIVLGVVFVKFLNWGVVGAALATVISQFMVDFFALRSLYAMDEAFRINLAHLHVSGDLVKRMLQLGIPASVQNMLIGISAFVVQANINLFPDTAIAGIGVADKIAVWAQIPMQSISTIGTNYVGQNLGAKKYDRVQQGIKLCVKIAVIITIITSSGIFLLAEPLVKLFNSNPEVISYGTAMVKYTVFAFIPLALSHIYNGCCRGAGNMMIPMIIAVMSQCIFKYVFVQFGLAINFDIHIIYLSNLLSYTLAGLGATLYFHLSKWTKEAHLRP